MPLHVFSDTNWHELGTGLVAATLQASGEDIIMSYGSTTPQASNPGYDLPNGQPVSPPNVSAFGGGMYVKSLRGGGSVRYDVA